MRKCFYADTEDMFSGIIVRNKGVLDYEKFIHQTFYPYIIHPYSRFRVYWEMLILILSPFKLTLFFFLWVFLKHSTFVYQFTVGCIQLLHFIEVILLFLTGYVEPNTEIVILDPKRIARRYLRGSFIFDFFSCIPLELIAYIYDRKCVDVTPLMITRKCHLIILSTVVGFLIRVWTFVRYLKNEGKIWSWNPFLPNLIAIHYFFFFIASFNFAFLFVYEGITHNYVLPYLETWMKLIMYLHFVVNFIFDLIFLNNAYVGVFLGYQIPILVFSFFFGIFCTVFFIKYIIGKMKAKERFFFLENRVKSYARRRNLPFTLRRRIILYFHVLFKNKYHKEDEIFIYVPDTFKADIFFHFCLPLLTSFQAFEEFPTYVLRRLAETLKYQLYLPNDLVISKKEPMMSMYFIQAGTVVLYSAKNVELYHFEAGSSISGKYFIEGKPLTNHYAVSIEVTEVYRLDYDNFMEIMASYPKLLAQMKEKFYLSKKTSHDFFGSAFDS